MLAPFALAACGFDAAGTGDGLRIRKDTAVDEPVEADAGVADTFVPPDEEDAYVAPPDTAPLFDVVDESPLPGCTVDAHGGHEYLFCELDSNWGQARTSCQIAGYDLVVIADKTEHDWVVGKLKSKSRGKWHIGLHDRDDEGKFKWVDGTAPGFTSWGSWEPNDFLWSEDCVILNKDGSWNDINCGDTLREGFICETP